MRWSLQRCGQRSRCKPLERDCWSLQPGGLKGHSGGRAKSIHSDCCSIAARVHCMPLERCGQSPLTLALGKGRAVVSRGCRWRIGQSPVGQRSLLVMRDWLMGMAPPILKRINKRQSPHSDILDILQALRGK